MEPCHKSVCLSFDPSVEAEVRHHVDIPELVFVRYWCLGTVGNQVDLFSLARHLVLISYRECQHQIFDVSLIGAH